MLNLAVTWGMIPGSPVAKVKPLMLPVNNERNRVLSDEEEARLLKACDPSWPGQAGYLKAMVVLALHTGLRVSEILSLKWESVNFPFGVITVEAANSKSKRVRRIPMNALVRKTLEEQQEGNQSEHVFCRADGSRFYWIDSAFRTACRRAGIEGLTFHDLRHTFATRLAEAHFPLTTIKELLGHSTIRMTERYAHATGQREAVESLLARKWGHSTTISTTVERVMNGWSL
jgi:integrase